MSHVHRREPLRESGHEGLGRVDRGDVFLAEDLGQHPHEPPGARAHVESLHPGTDSGPLRERASERVAVAPDEPVVHLGCDGEGHPILCASE
jgi:hypothetical protein